MRGVAVLGGGEGLISASRDRTARVWWRGPAAGGGAAGWADGEVLAGHTGFVTCCAPGPPGAGAGAGAGGLLATGSRDKGARVWRVAGNGEPPVCVGRADGHSEQVSGVAWLPAGLAPPRLATSSFDGTARVWATPAPGSIGGAAAMGGEISDLACLAVLEGHKNPVQCVVAMEDGALATGSGDCTIRVWREDGATGAWTCASVLEGHEDTVRSLTVLAGGGLASASHDGSIRIWSPRGNCTCVILTGHTAIIFCVAASPDGELLASGSDDGTCRVWQRADGAALQTLPHPGCVWDTAFLPGGELVTACSDGVLRVWSRDHSADPDVVATFEAAVAAREDSIRRARNPSEGGGALPDGLKVEDSVALQFPGTKAGEIKVVKEGSGAMAYQWDAAQGSWEKIGEVVAGAEKPAAEGGGRGKVVDGVEYDFVFDVDVADGQPPLRLPYNRGEDVYQAAERFIQRHELPGTYREQIVNFIVQNTPSGGGGPGLGGGSSAAGSADPFTGGGAYVPPSMPAADPRSGVTTAFNADPFTGTGASNSTGGGGGLFPIRSPIRMVALKAEGIRGKVLNFSEQLAASGQEALALGHEGPAALDSLLQKLGDSASGAPRGALALSEAEAALVSRLLEWPASHAFPAMDLLKNAILLPTDLLGLGFDFAGRALDRALDLAQDPGAPGATVQTGLRVLANGASADPAWMRRREADVLGGLAQCCRSDSKGIRLAWSTVLLNVSALRSANGGGWGPDAKLPVLSGALELLRVSFAFQDPEPAYRALCALGTCVLGDAESIAAAKGMGAAEVLTSVRGMGVKKVDEAAGALASALGLPN